MSHHGNAIAASAGNPDKTYDPTDPEIRQNPYPYFAKLRRDEPVKWLASVQAFIVSRYDDVDAMLRDPATYSSAHWYVLMFGEYDPVPEVPSIIGMDAPRHNRLRKLANKVFQPSKIDKIGQRVDDIANELIDDIVARHGPEGECNWVLEFTSLFSATVIAELIGIPTEQRAEFKGWIDGLLQAQNRAALDQKQLAQVRKCSDKLRTFFEELYELRSVNHRDDLASSLIEAEVDGEKLTRLEVIQMLVVLLLGGVESTANLLGSTPIELHRHPAVYDRVRNDLGLIPALIEEMLRFHSPVQVLYRNATRDTELDGVSIPKGAALIPLLASANRDESKFSNPESFDIDRRIDVPRMSFGQGPHVCIGRHLSLMEVRIALGVIFRRFETLRPVSDKVDWIDSFFVRGPHALPVHYKIR